MKVSFEEDKRKEKNQERDETKEKDIFKIWKLKLFREENEI